MRLEVQWQLGAKLGYNSLSAISCLPVVAPSWHFVRETKGQLLARRARLGSFRFRSDSEIMLD